jgi:hypothetical protein
MYLDQIFAKVHLHNRTSFRVFPVPRAARHLPRRIENIYNRIVVDPLFTVQKSREKNAQDLHARISIRTRPSAKIKFKKQTNSQWNKNSACETFVRFIEPKNFVNLNLVRSSYKVENCIIRNQFL